MSKKKSPKIGHRLTTPPTIKPLPAGRKLAPYSVPPIPAGKFTHCEGQAAMDFSSDDPHVLTEEEPA